MKTSQTSNYWQTIGLLLLVWLLAGCSLSGLAAATSTPPTPAAEISTPLPTVAPTTATTETAVPTQAASSDSEQTAAAVRIQFQPNTTQWYTNGDLAPNAAVRFVLTAMKGQQMSVWLTTEPASSDSSLAYLNIVDAKGSPMVFSPEMYFSQVLGDSQDYYVEVHSAAKNPINYTLSVEIPAAVIDPSLGDKYEPIEPSLCQAIQQTASEALGVDFSMQARAPFLDEFAGEAGQGCRLTAAGNGNTFSSPQDVVMKLTGSAGLGWTEQPAYQADGPTGSATALTRDMGLMLIKADWNPDMGVVCPSDKPISDCGLTPEQQIYTIRIDIAQYRATFSLDGHWEDAANDFSLDLNQDWKNIYGHHTAVAQGGNKIDSLDASINGSIKGEGAIVQFQSSFTDSIGEAQITLVDPNTITWKITTPPEGEYYLPAEATLVRK